MSVEYDTTFNPADEDTRRLARGLAAHSRDFTDGEGFEPVAVFLRDETGEITGGVSAYLNWNWLQVSLLWVEKSLRGSGHGSQLMQNIEEVGRENGCTGAHVSTFGFQAKTFYESLGYEVFASLGDYPPGHTKYLLKKGL